MVKMEVLEREHDADHQGNEAREILSSEQSVSVLVNEQKISSIIIRYIEESIRTKESGNKQITNLHLPKGIINVTDRKDKIIKARKFPSPIKLEDIIHGVQNLSTDELKNVIDIVYEYVVVERKYCRPFALLTKTLYSEYHKSDKSSEDDKKENFHLFQKFVLDLCEAKYRHGLVVESSIKKLVQVRDIMPTTQDVDERKAEIKLELEKLYLDRKTQFDNAWMIDAVYDVGLLSTEILVYSIKVLFAEGYYVYLAKLITAVGQNLETKLSKINVKTWENRCEGVGGIFKPEADSMYMVRTAMKIKKLSTSCELELDIRLKLLDVYELWKNKWNPNVKVPKSVRKFRQKAIRGQTQETKQKQKDQLKNKSVVLSSKSKSKPTVLKDQKDGQNSAGATTAAAEILQMTTIVESGQVELKAQVLNEQPPPPQQAPNLMKSNSSHFLNIYAQQNGKYDKNENVPSNKSSRFRVVKKPIGLAASESTNGIPVLRPQGGSFHQLHLTMTSMT